MLEWLSHPENTKPLGLLILFITFCLIVLWVYAGDRQRKESFEAHRNIPFLDDEANVTEETKDKSNG